jgi:hypothetical protein
VMLGHKWGGRSNRKIPVQTCIYIILFRHVCTLFRRVCTCLYKNIRALTHINMYISCTNMYIHVCSILLIYIHVCQGIYQCWCSVYRWLHTFQEMYRHFSFLFCPAGWPVGRD